MAQATSRMVALDITKALVEEALCLKTFRALVHTFGSNVVAFTSMASLISPASDCF